MTSLKIALVNEMWTAGATRCARDLESFLSHHHTVRYYPRHDGETLSSLLDDLSEFQPDVVHCHSYYGSFPYQFLATVSHRYPTCFTCHDPRPIGTIHHICWECPHANLCFRCAFVSRCRKALLCNPYFWKRLQKRCIHWKASKTLTLVTPSKWLKQRLLTTELKRFAIHHIPYGIDLKRFMPVSDARTSLGLSQEQQIILFVAHADTGWHLHPRKGLRELAMAFIDIVNPQNPDAMLWVAGEKLVPNHPKVKPLGLIPQSMLPLYYSAADVLAVPSLADNLPYTILEAMGCGTPVVASHVGGIPEEIENGVTGYLVPPSHPKALGNSLLKILENPHKRKEMRIAGRARAEELFNMERFIQQYEQLYRQIS